MLYTISESSCPKRRCNKCDSYRKEVEKYKYKYEIAKSGLTKEEKTMLIGLIENEQVKHMIARNEYNTDRYKHLEELKAKIRVL